MPISDDFNDCARRGGDHFSVTGAERFNARTQLLACTVACTHGQADVHVHFANNGNGIETGCNIRNISNVDGTWDFNAGSHLAARCIEYARAHADVHFPH